MEAPQRAVIEYESTDAAIFLLLLRFGMELFLGVSLIVLVIVLPINLTSGGVEALLAQAAAPAPNSNITDWIQDATPTQAPGAKQGKMSISSSPPALVKVGCGLGGTANANCTPTSEPWRIIFGTLNSHLPITAMPVQAPQLYEKHIPPAPAGLEWWELRSNVPMLPQPAEVRPLLKQSGALGLSRRMWRRAAPRPDGHPVGAMPGSWRSLRLLPLCSLPSVPWVQVLGPEYARFGWRYNANYQAVAYHFSSLDRTTLANVPPGSPRLFAHALVTWLVSLYALRLLWRYHREALALRIQHLVAAPQGAESHTILLTDIPGVSFGTVLHHADSTLLRFLPRFGSPAGWQDLPAPRMGLLPL